MALPPPDLHSTALVTGASSGIGADIARELAKRGHGVTLVARREERLRKLADEITKDHDVRAEIASCDVTDPAARDRLISEVADRGLSVEILVNNAGFGSGGTFYELDIDKEISMIRTNVEAVVAFCGTYVPQMVKRGQGAVLNVASTAAFQPIPRQATYAASKAFVLSFTESLHTELRGKGVTATALCPGPVNTEFSDVGELKVGFDELPSFIVQTPEETASAAVKAMEKGRRSVVPGPANAVSAVAGRLTPRTVLLPMMDRFYPL